MPDKEEEKEGTDGAEIFGHAVRFMILLWSLAIPRMLLIVIAHN